jgi:hypothetical protein
MFWSEYVQFKNNWVEYTLSLHDRYWTVLWLRDMFYHAGQRAPSPPGLFRVELEVACGRAWKIFHHQQESQKIDFTIDISRSFLCISQALPMEVWYIIQHSLGGTTSFRPT